VTAGLRKSSGFTLLEVLVAMAILATATGAIIQAVGNSANQLGYLRNQTLAGWVALNEINRVLLEQEWPEATTLNGTTEMATQNWQWQMEISATSDKDLRRLDVTVSLADDEEATLATLTAFKGRPPS
jgi:general secretion pathway protein I